MGTKVYLYMYVIVDIEQNSHYWHWLGYGMNSFLLVGIFFKIRDSDHSIASRCMRLPLFHDNIWSIIFVVSFSAWDLRIEESDGIMIYGEERLTARTSRFVITSTCSYRYYMIIITAFTLTQTDTSCNLSVQSTMLPEHKPGTTAYYYLITKYFNYK